MFPLTFFAGMLTLTLAAFLANATFRRRAAHQLRRLAGEWGMHYAETDRFQLTARVVERFPVPGASDVCVVDIVYTQDADRYRYLFTVNYTEGVVRTKNRVTRVATFCEPRERRTAAAWSELRLAPSNLGWLDQYHCLRDGPESTRSQTPAGTDSAVTVLPAEGHSAASDSPAL